MNIKEFSKKFFIVIIFGWIVFGGKYSLEGKVKPVSSFFDKRKSDSVLHRDSQSLDDDLSLEYQVTSLNNTMGLSNSSVTSVFQDSDGLLWFGSWDGLNRYDGKTVKVYTPQLDDNKSISNQVITKITQDGHNRIWVLTKHGINSYNKEKDNFNRFLFSKEDTLTISQAEFNMAIDTKGEIICSVKNWGLGYFKDNEFSRIDFKRYKKQFSKWSFEIQKMVFDTRNNLFLLNSKNELYRVNITPYGNGKKIISNYIKVTDHVKTFEVFRNNVFVLNNSGIVNRLNSDGTLNNEIITRDIKDIKGTIPEGMLLAKNKGYALLNKRKEVTTPNWVPLINKYKINNISKDQEGTIWLGTDGDGAVKIYQDKNFFHTITSNDIKDLHQSIVRAFERDSENFYVGTKGQGLFHFKNNLFNNEWYKNYTVFNEDNSAINNRVYALKAIQDGMIIIGSDGDGIQVLDTYSHMIIPWSDLKKTGKESFFKSVYSIYQDEEHNIWLGTNGYGFVKLKLERKKNVIAIQDFKSYDLHDYVGLNSNTIYSIVPENNHEIWLGTRLGGLSLFNKEKESFRAFTHNESDKRSLSSNDILFLKKDNQGFLWIGTSLGLNKLNFDDRDNPFFSRYTTKDGLPNNTIHSIVFDDNGDLWIGTNLGLSHYDKKRNKFFNYNQTDDRLQNNEFSDGAIFKDNAGGFIFAGGIKGFNYFDPLNLPPPSTELPDIYIDKINGMGYKKPYCRSLIFSADSIGDQNITLNHNQNFFEMNLSAITYVNHGKIQYAYKLKGFDKTWNYNDYISYTNVPSGKYDLWLKWTSKDGAWSQPIRAINFHIKPIVWKTNTAYTVYICLFGLLLWFLHNYYKKRQTLKQNLIFQKKEEEIHQNRIRFFTNIAHELQTPLTLIVGPAHKLSQFISGNKEHSYLKMIQNNSSRLLFLTQQLLEFRKAEYDYLDISAKKFDFVNLINQLTELFEEWAVKKNIEYTVDVPKELDGWFDKDKVEKIIFNLLSNAFKYTPENGKIKISVSAVFKEGKMIEIKVINTGKGISRDKIKTLFNRFESTDAVKNSVNSTEIDNEVVRTGIGLAYINKLISVLKGQVSVSSEENKKTAFTILLPCSINSFDEKQRNYSKQEVFISNYLKNVLDEDLEYPDASSTKNRLEKYKSEKKKIFLVEDEYNIHNFIKTLLKEKYQIISAYNGIDALKLIKNNMPDLIISDIMMDEMDGVELCRQIKNNIDTCQVPFLMLTAKDKYVHIKEGLDSGANAYIKKPFHPDHLLAQIEKLLERKELLKEHFLRDPSIVSSIKIPENDKEKDILNKIVQLIQENIEAGNINEILENKLGMSRSKLYRKIKEIFDMTPGSLIRNIKLKYAANLLQETSLNVSEICYKTGFNNRSYFFREFKKMYKSSPSNYRNKHNHEY